MAKGSGSTKKVEAINNMAIDYVKAGHGDAWGDSTLEMMNNWDELSTSQKLLALEKSGVDGLVNMDEFDINACTYKEMTNKQMTDAVGEVLDNIKFGYNMEDENHYIIGIKGQKEVWTHELYPEDIKGNNYHNMSIKGSDGKFHSLTSRNITYICANSGMSNYGYWVKDEAAKAQLKKLGFDEVKKGKIIN